MSKTTSALLIKLGLTFVAAWLAIGVVGNNYIGYVIWVALAGTALNYLIGDLLVLPTMGNLVAALGDGLMAALTAYIIALLVEGYQTSFGSLVLFGALVAVAEYMFHRYLLASDKVAP